MVTRRVTEDTSSDTITFEEEAFPLGTEQASESFPGVGVGWWGEERSREGPCLEMTHGTGLEVGGSPRAGAVHLTQPLLSCGSFFS